MRLQWAGMEAKIGHNRITKNKTYSELAGLGGKTFLHSVRVFCAHLDPPNAHMG